MNKKGFTLIELLAIIVILAIIGVITIPILLNVIDTSNKGAAVDSAYGFKEAINKYFLTESMDNNQIILDGIYSINDGVLNGNTISNKEIPVSGKKPSKGYLKYDNNNLVLACLAFGDYEVKYENNEFTSTGKGDCTIKGDFEHDEWSTIVSNLSIDRNAYNDDLLAGTTKIIELDLNGDKTISNSEKFNVRIANTSDSVDNGCREKVNGVEQHKAGFSETACGIVIEFADIITRHRMNPYTNGSTNGDGNKGGWEYSEMRKYLNGAEGYTGTVIYNLLPDVLKNNIADTIVVSGYGKNDTSNFTTTDKIYLLSSREVWNNTDNSDTAQANTRQLDYYEKKGVTTSANVGVAIKKNGNSNGYWSLRSASSYNASGFDIVRNNGGHNYYNYNSNNTYGVAPAFRINID